MDRLESWLVEQIKLLDQKVQVRPKGPMRLGQYNRRKALKSALEKLREIQQDEIDDAQYNARFRG